MKSPPPAAAASASDSSRSGAPGLAPDAAIVLGLASTALPFARTPRAEAERWLRLLRLHGRAGATLRALGVSEGPLAEAGSVDGGERERASRSGVHGGEGGVEATGGEDFPERDAATAVADHAARVATARHAPAVATSDLLLAVLDVYGAHFDSVLRAHGTSRDAVLAQLELAGAGAAPGEEG